MPDAIYPFSLKELYPEILSKAINIFIDNYYYCSKNGNK